MKQKLLFAVLFLAIVSLMLSGCGSTEPTEPAASSEPAVQPTPVPTSAAADNADVQDITTDLEDIGTLEDDLDMQEIEELDDALAEIENLEFE